MSEFHKLDGDLYIYGQITPDHISQAASEGIKTIINLRPDGEKPDYIDADKAAEIAINKNIEYHHIPVAMTGPIPDQVTSFAQTLGGCEGPVLAHCGSGKRAAILWALISKGKLSADDIIATCANSGHDLSKLRPNL